MTSDLTQLESLEECNILEALRDRYFKEKYYTFVGDILLAINPFRDVPIYSPEYNALYTGIPSGRGNSEPHIFWSAQMAYNRLQQTNSNQCILVSGESGAGKTESTKYMIQHITSLCKDGRAELHEKIIKVNPLLEAFGNAQTIMNRNSSRFGKYIELYFTDNYKIVGGKVSDYMLEKSRVVQQNQGERNFHIFYNAVFGMTDTEREQYHLKKKSFRILGQQRKKSQGGLDNETSAHQSTWTNLMSTLNEVDFDEDAIDNIVSMVASILHISDIGFIPSEDGAETKVNYSESLELACELLSIDSESLQDALTTSSLVTGGDRVVKFKSMAQASDGRDALTKWLYERLFGWIVKQINLDLEPKAVDVQDVRHKIGILDISGFENFKHNSFEQICINVANEQLHHFFNEYLFVREQEDYKEEGIPLKLITFTNNDQLLQLMVTGQLNILSLMDDESKLIGQASDERLVQKMDEHFQKHPKYECMRTNPMKFNIHHYAGKVEYDAHGFIDKNRDTLSDDLTDVMKQSGNLLIADLFCAEITATGSISRSKSRFRRGMSTKFGSKRSKGGPVQAKKMRKKTIAYYFKNSLKELVEKMSICQPLFVRCIKPNTEQRAVVFNDEYISTQLKYNGILSTAKIRKSGYPIRLTMHDFVDRYRQTDPKLWHTQTSVPDIRHACKQLLHGISPSEYALGTSKIFMKLTVPNALHMKQKHVEKMVIKAQAFVRGFLARKIVEKIKQKQIEEEARRKRDEEHIKKNEEHAKMVEEIKKHHARERQGEKQMKHSEEHTMLMENITRGVEELGANTSDEDMGNCEIENKLSRTRRAITKADSGVKPLSVRFSESDTSVVSHPNKSFDPDYDSDEDPFSDLIPGVDYGRGRMGGTIVRPLGVIKSQPADESQGFVQEECKQVIFSPRNRNGGTILCSKAGQNPLSIAANNGKDTEVESSTSTPTSSKRSSCPSISSHTTLEELRVDVECHSDNGSEDPDSGSEVHWDRFQKREAENQKAGRDYDRILVLMKLILYLVLFCVFLATGIASKGCILLMTSGINPKNEEQKQSLFSYLIVCIGCPYAVAFVTGIMKALFGSQPWPKIKVILWVLFTETLHSLGLCIFVFRVLPKFDMLHGFIMFYAVGVFPALFKLCLSTRIRVQGLRDKCGCFRTFLDFIVLFLQLGTIVYIMLSDFGRKPIPENGYHNGSADNADIGYHNGSADNADIGYHNGSANILSMPTFKLPPRNDIWEIPIALILISITWWENFAEANIECGNRTLFRIKLMRAAIYGTKDKITVITAMWKMGLTVLFSYLLSTEMYTPQITLTPTNGFLEFLPCAVQCVAAGWCYYNAMTSCKLLMQRLTFFWPAVIIFPSVVTVLVVNMHYPFLPTVLLGSDSKAIFTVVYPPKADALVYDLAVALAAFLSFMWITLHVFFPQSDRLDKNEKLFVKPFYCGSMVEQFLMLNRRKNDNEQFLKVLKYCVIDDVLDDVELGPTFQEMALDTYLEEEDGYVPPTIYACATMWHETRNEMMQILKSIFRMDIDYLARKLSTTEFGMNRKDVEYYEYETHIFVDDAMYKNDEGEWVPNDYVKQLVEIMNEAGSSVLDKDIQVRPPVKVSTPYGGRLEWTLPGGTQVIAHLKNKSKIRHRKRWSQIMYMYYLLGYKLEKMCQESLDESMSRRDSMIHVNNYQQKADNTFLLALDGDVDFRPQAVGLLVDKMRKNKKVGAVCGRIHPIGSGPLVWYQKFEYAIGHWLQKATEHVLGCVLCSPGCFSLFRGSAIMDINVMCRYADKPTEASHYVQFDQGEDRWLCTLLLQQGHRVDYVAASDSFTFAPEEFKELFNQRRRWMPSTLFNIMDLLKSAPATVRNNDNISWLYMAYQIALMISTVLGPSTVSLMMGGSLKSLFPEVNLFVCHALASGPPIVFLVICLTTKTTVQLFLAGILSAVYALVMLAVIVGILVSTIQQPFNGTTFFLALLIGLNIIAGLLHPKEIFCLAHGFLYFLCIPAGYLFLVIYSLCNLNIVSWGTREAPKKRTPEEIKAEEEAAANKKKKKKGYFSWMRGNDDVKDAFSTMFSTSGREAQMKMMNLLEALDDNVKKLLQKPNKTGILRERSADDEQEHIKHNVRFEGAVVDTEEVDDTPEDEGEELVPEEVKDNWFKTEGLGDGPIEGISAKEEMFWNGLIEKYLYPLEEDKEQQRKIAEDLVALRNNINFGFWFVNAIWMVINIMFEYKKHLLQPKAKLGNELVPIDILGWLFLSFFAVVMTVQFFGMLSHRWGTFLHLMSVTRIRNRLHLRSVMDWYTRDNDFDESPIELSPEEVVSIATNAIKNSVWEPDPDYDEEYDNNEEAEVLLRPNGHNWSFRTGMHLKESIVSQRFSVGPGATNPQAIARRVRQNMSTIRRPRSVPRWILEQRQHAENGQRDNSISRQRTTIKINPAITRHLTRTGPQRFTNRNVTQMAGLRDCNETQLKTPIQRGSMQYDQPSRKTERGSRDCNETQLKTPIQRGSMQYDQPSRKTERGSRLVEQQAKCRLRRIPYYDNKLEVGFRRFIRGMNPQLSDTPDMPVPVRGNTRKKSIPGFNEEDGTEIPYL